MADAAALAQRAATVAQVLVPDLDAPVLLPDEHHHLAKVLRVRDGEALSIVDGRGGWRLGRWSADRVIAEGNVTRDARPTTTLGVAFPPLKGDRTELVVQKLTELGVDELQLLHTSRGVVHWGLKEAKALQRLVRVAHEAAMQSRRTWLPTVRPPITVREAVAQGYVLTSWHGDPITSNRPAKVAIGPEGGWTPEEFSASAELVSLGTTVLRAETAAIAAATLLTSLGRS